MQCLLFEKKQYLPMVFMGPQKKREKLMWDDLMVKDLAASQQKVSSVPDINILQVRLRDLDV